MAQASSQLATAVAACPYCGRPMIPSDSLFLCSRCGYRRLTASGRARVEAKLLAALKALLAEQRGKRATVTLRKLVHAARATGDEFDRVELRYLATRWRQVLRKHERVKVNGATWRCVAEGRGYVVYARAVREA